MPTRFFMSFIHLPSSVIRLPRYVNSLTCSSLPPSSLCMVKCRLLTALPKWNKKLRYRRDIERRQSLRRSRSFKITDVSTIRKPACDLLLVNNTNLHPISQRYPIIIPHFCQIIASLIHSFSVTSVSIATNHVLLKTAWILNFFGLHSHDRQRRYLQLHLTCPMLPNTVA